MQIGSSPENGPETVISIAMRDSIHPRIEPVLYVHYRLCQVHSRHSTALSIADLARQHKENW